MTITGALRAVASVTISLMVWSRAHCPRCGRLVISFPGEWAIEARPISEPTGSGCVMACQRCRTLLEVVPHG